MSETGGTDPNPTPYALPEPPPPPTAPLAAPQFEPVAATKAPSHRGVLIATAVVIVLVVAGLVVNSLTSKDPPSLPHFTEVRPTYGTIHMSVTYSEQLGSASYYAAESNAQADVVHIVGQDRPSPIDTTAQTTNFEYIVSADEFWAYDFGQAMWMKAASPSAEGYGSVKTVLTTLMFSEYVPDSLRPYISIKGVTEEKVSVHDVTVYDLRLDVVAYHDSGAADYDAWAERMGIDEPTANTTLELAVDNDGVVWRMRSFSTLSLGQSQTRNTDYEQVVTALLPQEYQPDYPSRYFDEASNQEIG